VKRAIGNNDASFDAPAVASSDCLEDPASDSGFGDAQLFGYGHHGRRSPLMIT